MKTINIRRFATILLLSMMAISVCAQLDLPDIQREEGEEKEVVLYNISEIWPQFPGGDAALMKFLEENVRCPKKAIRKGVHGRVVVSFFVEKDGSITELKIAGNFLKDKSGNPCTNSSIIKRCEKEALRVFKLMPKWSPGRQGNRVVRVKYCAPVLFNQPKPKSD